jgi:hypothetical protein
MVDIRTDRDKYRHQAAYHREERADGDLMHQFDREDTLKRLNQRVALLEHEQACRENELMEAEERAEEQRDLMEKLELATLTCMEPDEACAIVDSICADVVAAEHKFHTFENGCYTHRCRAWAFKLLNVGVGHGEIAGVMRDTARILGVSLVGTKHRLLPSKRQCATFSIERGEIARAFAGEKLFAAPDTSVTVAADEGAIRGDQKLGIVVMLPGEDGPGSQPTQMCLGIEQIPNGRAQTEKAAMMKSFGSAARAAQETRELLRKRGQLAMAGLSEVDEEITLNALMKKTLDTESDGAATAVRHGSFRGRI